MPPREGVFAASRDTPPPAESENDRGLRGFGARYPRGSVPRDDAANEDAASSTVRVSDREAVAADTTAGAAASSAAAKTFLSAAGAGVVAAGASHSETASRTAGAAAVRTPFATAADCGTAAAYSPVRADAPSRRTSTGSCTCRRNRSGVSAAEPSSSVVAITTPFCSNTVSGRNSRSPATTPINTTAAAAAIRGI